MLETAHKDPEVMALTEALSAELEARFGSSGKNSFQDWEENNAAYVFVKARIGNIAVGCGAIRPISPEIAEIKRMYALYPRQGIGQKILIYLEQKARQLGYQAIWLETRKLNTEACHFYRKNNYEIMENYGKYAGNEQAICFGKRL